MTEFGCNQVAKTMDTPYGQFVSSQVNNALDFSEQYVEKYLPESDSEDEGIIIIVLQYICLSKNRIVFFRKRCLTYIPSIKACMF